MFPSRFALKLVAVIALMLATPARADDAPVKMQPGMNHGGMQGMSKGMEMSPARFEPTREAYTEKHMFLVRLVDLPEPIPYQKHFTVRFAVFDGQDTGRQLGDAAITLQAGMRHGMASGFAHGMNSAPKMENRQGGVAAEGMYFHMMGRWTVKVTVKEGGREDVAYFDLPCCGS